MNKPLVQAKKAERISFASTKSQLSYPDFLDIQLKSFHEFFQLDRSVSIGRGRSIHKRSLHIILQVEPTHLPRQLQHNPSRGQVLLQIQFGHQHILEATQVAVFQMILFVIIEFESIKSR